MRINRRTTMTSIKDAAEELGVHANTIRHWFDTGLIHGHRLPSGTRRIPTSEVERIEHEMLMAPTSFYEPEMKSPPKRKVQLPEQQLHSRLES